MASVIDSNKQKKVTQTNDCNVESCVNRCNLCCEFDSIWFYIWNVRLYICCVSLNLYITSCVLNLSLLFLYIRCFGECERFFYLKRDFLQKHEHHRTRSSLQYGGSDQMLVVITLSKTCWMQSTSSGNMFWGVRVFEFNALYVFSSI